MHFELEPHYIHVTYATLPWARDPGSERYATHTMAMIVVV